MTSSNVSNLMMARPTKESGPYVTIKGEGAIKDNTFEKALNAISNSDLSKYSASRNEAMKNMNAGSAEITLEGSASAKVTVEVKESSAENKTLSNEEVTELKDKVEKFGSEVKEAIGEELDVTEEEIEKAMETLGLTAIDLADPINLAKLVLELSESNDSISLIFDEGFNSLFDKVNELFLQLLDETGISPFEIKDIMISLEVDASLDVNVNASIPQESVADQDTLLTEEVDGEEILIGPETKVQKEASSEELPEEVLETDSTKTLDTVQKPEAKNDRGENQSDNPKDSDLGERTEIGKESQGIVFSAEQRFEVNYSQEEPTVTLPTGETVQASEIIDQLVEKAAVFSTSESTTMEMTLNPEGLGKVFMEVTQKGQEITAKIFTENQAVKEVLENQMASLKTQLSNTSTKVTSIEISVATHEFERNLEQGMGRENQQQEQRENIERQIRRNRIDLGSLDELSGLMTEEESLVYNMMRDNGNTLDYQA